MQEEDNSGQRITIETKRIVIVARGYGMPEMLPWRHDIEELLAEATRLSGTAPPQIERRLRASSLWARARTTLVVCLQSLLRLLLTAGNRRISNNLTRRR
jgi:hypothetical protein